MRINPLEHPICVVNQLRHTYGDDLVFKFSRYRYIPQSVAEHRVAFERVGKDVTVDWLESELKLLKPEEELALSSHVIHRGEVKHIPMADLVVGPKLRASILFELIPSDLVGTLSFFDSGNSYHAYGTSLIHPDDWIRFMGLLLLCNLPNGPRVVDDRWIGHRLIAGYSSLRISCNSYCYRKMPKLVNRPMVG